MAAHWALRECGVKLCSGSRAFPMSATVIGAPETSDHALEDTLRRHEVDLSPEAMSHLKMDGFRPETFEVASIEIGGHLMMVCCCGVR